MKISEIILDKLNDTRLFEMAFDRKSAKQQFSNLTLQLKKHLIKIVAFKDGMNYQHHCHEINNWLDDLDTVRWNRTQRLKKDTIMELLWDGPLGHGAIAVEDTINTMIRVHNYTVPRNQLSYHQIYELLFKVYDEMSFDLSRGKVDSIQHYLTKNGYQVENP